MEEKDMVNHPPHYIAESGIEAIDVIESFTEDLKKAEWYLKRLIDKIEKENE